MSRRVHAEFWWGNTFGNVYFENWEWHEKFCCLCKTANNIWTEQWSFRDCGLLIWALGVVSELKSTRGVLVGKHLWECLLRKLRMIGEDKGKAVPMHNEAALLSSHTGEQRQRYAFLTSPLHHGSMSLRTVKIPRNSLGVRLRGLQNHLGVAEDRKISAYAGNQTCITQSSRRIIPVVSYLSRLIYRRVAYKAQVYLGKTGYEGGGCLQLTADRGVCCRQCWTFGLCYHTYVFEWVFFFIFFSKVTAISRVGYLV
jgi:hypothetical protein